MKKKVYFITKEDLVNLGFDPDRVIEFPTPVMVINKITVVAKTYKFENTDEILSEFQDTKACGIIVMKDMTNPTAVDLVPCDAKSVEEADVLIMRIFHTSI